MEEVAEGEKRAGGGAARGASERPAAAGERVRGRERHVEQHGDAARVPGHQVAHQVYLRLQYVYHCYKSLSTVERSVTQNNKIITLLMYTLKQDEKNNIKKYYYIYLGG